MKTPTTCIWALIGLMSLAFADILQSVATPNQKFQAMTQQQVHLYEKFYDSKRNIVILASNMIDELEDSATDQQIQPILQALVTAAIVDPENESAQTAYMLITRFGKERIVKLTMQTDTPSRLLAGIRGVEIEGKDG